MSTTDDALLSAEKLEQRLQFEALISALSPRFINLRPGEVDREIEDALRLICEALDIDFAILWQWSQAAADIIAPTPVYQAQEGPRPSEPMQQDADPLELRSEHALQRLGHLGLSVRAPPRSPARGQVPSSA